MCVSVAMALLMSLKYRKVVSSFVLSVEELV